ncbi:1838_t:CDS:2 [Paraglomus occultum]|uniref:1838_t:CDS:1 n=1 Tax=Paraglomus occultum TaxID=144539 RepID=A0A9N9D7D2_9GLOM|nr:1838_t:CDS:2 [Paraglomus occultum]
MRRFGQPLPKIDNDNIKTLAIEMVMAPDFCKAVNDKFLPTRGSEMEFLLLWDFAYQL